MKLNISFMELVLVYNEQVSGGARGADTLAKEYAVRNDIPLIEFLPEYDRYGRRAPLMRNIQIIDNSDFLLAFWDGTSRGTRFTIDYAVKRGVPYKVVSIVGRLSLEKIAAGLTPCMKHRVNSSRLSANISTV